MIVYDRRGIQEDIKGWGDMIEEDRRGWVVKTTLTFVLVKY